MSALSRRKGAEHERAVVRLAREAGFVKAERRAPMQAGHPDADEHPDVAGVAMLWLEAKHEARASPRAYARKYLGRERPGYVPVVAWRSGGMGENETVAELLLTDLLALVRELVDLRQRSEAA